MPELIALMNAMIKIFSNITLLLRNKTSKRFSA